MIDRVTDYATRTWNAQEMGVLHLLACKRHLRDLGRQGAKEFPYIWQPEKSEQFLNFAETLTISEGTSPKPVRLYPHQCFDYGSLFGWVQVETMNRRFRRNYNSVARQNGKSFGNGLLGTYISGFSGYKNGKLFTAATKRRQSRIAWDEIRKFVEVDPDLAKFFRVQEWKNTITALTSGCTIEALSKEGGLDEGFRSIFTSLDELHQMKDNSIYSSLYRGTMALEETLLSMITTRGKNLDSFAYEMDRYAVNVLQGTATAEDMFVDIYAIDKTDDFFDPSVWIKANPYLMQTAIGRENLQTNANTARDMGGMELAEFVTKSLNLWYRDQSNSFIDIDAWNDCGRSGIDITGRKCYIGLDLSSGGDLTSVGFNFDIDGKDYFDSHSFMPMGRFEEHIQTDMAPYDVWQQAGLLTLTGGSGDFITDYLYIIDYLKDFISDNRLKVLGIAYDRHNISSLLPYLDDFGVPLMDMPQSARALNDATKNIQLKTKSRKIIHNKDNELLTWSMANAAVTENSFGEIKVDKQAGRRNGRIDPVDAAINAHAMKLDQRQATSLNDAIMSGEWSM